MSLSAWLRRRRRSAPAPASAAGADGELLRERQRIYQNLHDDLGAKLLDLVYGAETPAQADRAREALQILRDVVSQSARAAGPLPELLDTIRAELAQRLGALDVALDWQQQSPLPAVALDQARVLHLSRIVREAVSNALRHGRTRALRVRVSELAGELVLEITDYGVYDPQGIGAGQGTVGMRERAAELQGDIQWDEATQGGTKVLLRFPLTT
ncbi:ATP-binding protein [Stagnimonas aquatica]|uniref:histidine kinase n=1 Tax=Stagnimonas aquatica TaxID=2689987 RepID=A0A3N0V2L3_9GAMM|nr:ATP-binding protein [Stagnimonas aquatica]ROH86794.1 ATP-binding protein [Stagnimonas aquatica]